jgi:RNA polymerase sigma factor FliA
MKPIDTVAETQGRLTLRTENAESDVQFVRMATTEAAGRARSRAKSAKSPRCSIVARDENRDSAGDIPSGQESIWDRYAISGPGSEDEAVLVQDHMALVKSLVSRIAATLPAHADIDDLYSAGLLGLLDAVRRYDPLAGAAFGTYARLRIRGAIFDELRRLDWVPRSIHDKARRVDEVMRTLEAKTGELPTSSEMARALDMSLEEYEDLQERIRPTSFVSLDSTRRDEAEMGSDRYEWLKDATQAEAGEEVVNQELIELICKRLEKMPEMQRRVLALYYFEDLRLREIAETLGVTESRVCQIHAQAILSLKTYFRRREAQAACCRPAMV